MPRSRVACPKTNRRSSTGRSRSWRARRANSSSGKKRKNESQPMKTRITELLGIEHPIFQAAMSWASSNSKLVIEVSNAGGLGILAAGPLRVPDFQKIILEIKDGTKKPWGLNVPLNNPKAKAMLDI